MTAQRSVTKRKCPRCGDRTAEWNCCGINLTVRRARWSMSAENIRLVHVVKSRKGLDEETYRLRLGAVGVASCKDLNQAQFRKFLEGMATLPDSPTWQPKPRVQAVPGKMRRARG